jgi:hypothetical protein
VAQRWGGELVHDALADDDAASGREITAAIDELGDGGLDGGSARRAGLVVDRPVGCVDEPEPLGLQPPQHGRLVGQLHVRLLAVQSLRDPAVWVVAAEGGGRRRTGAGRF